MRRGTLVLAAGALAGLWIDTARRTARSERQHPPSGRWLDAGGARLHCLDRGPDREADRERGQPLVFLHGAGGTADDWAMSLLDEAAQRRRCVAFDRPGHGYSDQPAGCYSPAAQAALLRAGVRALGLERPILVGHSLGGAVALAWALAHPDEVGGVVFLSGFAYPTPRIDALPLLGPALPVVGPVLSRTVLPPIDRLILAPFLTLVFAPNPVSPGYARLPGDFLLRPTQLEAAAKQVAALIPGVAELAPFYPSIRCPVAIVAGMEDRIVGADDHAVPLHEAIEGSTLHLLPGTGHMPHHAQPKAVLSAIEQVAAAGTPHRVAARG